MQNIEQALQKARTPGSIVCPVCSEELLAPMDKLSIALYGKCILHHEDDSTEEHSLINIIQHF